MDLCLRIFEASMSATPLAVSALCDSRRDVATALGHMVLGCHILALSPHDPSDSNPESRHAQTAMDGLLSALRMLIDLTTSDPAWSVALAQVDDIISTLIKLIVATRTAESTTVARFRELSSPAPGELSLKKDDDRKTKSKEEGIAQSSMREDVKFDVLCLALGVLTNLVESVDEVKTVLRTTRESRTGSQDFADSDAKAHAQSSILAASINAVAHVAVPVLSDRLHCIVLQRFIWTRLMTVQTR